LGGAIAAFFAGVFPEHVRKLILLEGIGLWRGEQEAAGTAALIRQWSEINRDLAGRTPRRYPDLQTAYQRMQDANPQLTQEQAMHLTAHGVVQLEEVRSIYVQLSGRGVIRGPNSRALAEYPSPNAVD
jgi:pimeloyl-ACP methyl ester carboxylesterase